MSILYIDDDTEDIEIFEEAIREVDASIRYASATSGRDALDMLNRSESVPDHIILDVNMPGMDGPTCLKEIRKEKRFDLVNIIVYSTSSCPSDIEKINSLGATFIQKATSFAALC